MQKSQVKENMIRNHVSKRKNQNDYHWDKIDFNGEPVINLGEKRWQKIEPETLYHMLVNCSKHLRPSINKMLEVMAKKPWTIRSTAHKGGKDPNAPLHITISIKNQLSHHLNCREDKFSHLHIYEITQKPINYINE